MKATPFILMLGLSGPTLAVAETAPAAHQPAAPAHEAHGSSGSMAQVPRSLSDWARGAQLFEGLGTTHRAITTRSKAAQQYFDQGLRLTWAFNHDEATRSFARATELDPACAMCFWGVALTVGPNYNLPFLVEERARVAHAALLDSVRLAPRASPVEQALIVALQKRYPTAEPLDPPHMRPVLIAYSDAMGAVAHRFPDDLDVQTLYAESMMNINAWKLWTPEGKAAPGTERIVATLESVLARDPQHPGANHYYVHAIEASPHPEKALASAERLGSAMPAAGHLVHMPAHIMQRVGRYEDAAEANRRAAAADAAYNRLTTPPDYYPTGYTAHNYQFLAFSTAMQGRADETLRAVDASRAAVPDAMLTAMPGMDWYVTEMYAARVRFGRWDELIAMPPPDTRLLGLTCGYLHARTVALAARGRVAEAKDSLKKLMALAESSPPDAGAGQNALRDVLAVAVPSAQARVATAMGRDDQAIAHLRAAAAAEDRLAYDEPKNWFFPVRHELGALLMKTGRPVEAEAVYREDLKQNPANGWSLFGLRLALEAQGRAQEAKATGQAFDEAWKRADTILTASAF